MGRCPDEHVEDEDSIEDGAVIDDSAILEPVMYTYLEQLIKLG